MNESTKEKSNMDKYKLLHVGPPLHHNYQPVSTIAQYYTLVTVIDYMSHLWFNNVDAAKNAHEFFGLT